MIPTSNEAELCKKELTLSKKELPDLDVYLNAYELINKP
jgi:hypothetical protein